MLRLFLALNIFFFNLYACKGGFASCKAKVKDSHAIKQKQLQIPIKKHQRLIYSKTTPKAKILKYDPFLSLYLVEDKKGFRYPFYINRHQYLGVASVDAYNVIEGRIVKKQIGLNHFATFNQKTNSPALLLNSCCALEGIVTQEGIIQKEYIERFLRVKKVSYADIGIRLKDIETKSVVDAVNPFIDKNKFLEGDVILVFDNKKVKYSSDLMRWILFSKIGSKHTLKVKRSSKIIKIDVISQKRYNEGYLSNAFFEYLGLYFDKNLCITKIELKAKKYQLKLGDKLLRIDKEYLLFERDGFEFFIHIINNRLTTKNI